MKLSNIKVLLETMCYYNTTNIKEVYTIEGGSSLSLRYVHRSNTFELIHIETEEVIHMESINETAEYIRIFIQS